MPVNPDSVIVDLVVRNQQYDAAVNASADNFERGARRTARAANDIEDSTRKAGFAARNFSFQLSDIGTQLTGGQSPFLILSQQGPQVVQAFQEISQSGAGFATVLRTAALPAALAFGPLLVSLAASLVKTAGQFDGAKEAADRFTAAIERLKAKGQGSDRDQAFDLIGKNNQKISALEGELRRVKGLAGSLSVGLDPLDIEAAQRAQAAAANRLERQIATLRSQNAKAQSAIDGDDAMRAAQSRIAAANDRDRQAQRDAAKEARAASKERETAAEREQKAWEEAQIAARNYIFTLGQEIHKDFEKQIKQGAEDGLGADEKQKPVRQQIAENTAAELKAREDKAAADKAAADELARREYQQIQTLADFYQVAFTRGAKGIGDALKYELTRAISVSLAKFVIAQASSLLSPRNPDGTAKTVTGIASIAAQFGNYLAGRATGGPVAPNTTYLVGERGPELLRMGNQGGVVIPNPTNLSRAGSTTIVNQTFQLDARYGITTTELLDHVETVRREAVSTAAQAGRAAYRSAPDAVARQQILGNP